MKPADVPQELEQVAATTAPAPLPPPAGDQRYQAALDGDRTYRRSLYAALVLAFMAGTGFGQMGRSVGWLHTALWCVTAAGIVHHCTNQRPRGRGDEPDERSASNSRYAVAGLSAGFGVIQVLGGRQGRLASVAVLIGSAVMCAVVLLWPLLTNGKGRRWRPGLVIARLGACCWLWVALGDLDPLWWRLLAFIACLGLLGLLDLWLARRSSVAPVIASLVALQFAAAPTRTDLLHMLFWAQSGIALLECLLVVVMAYRHAQAAASRLPLATYRIGPLCVVPRLDRAWDHPVKINVQ